MCLVSVDHLIEFSTSETIHFTVVCLSKSFSQYKIECLVLRTPAVQFRGSINIKYTSK